MKRFIAPVSIVVTVVAFVASPRPDAAASSGPVPVIDLHVDISYRSVYKGAAFAEGSGQFRANDLVDAGVRGVVLPLFVPQDAASGGRTRQQFERSYAHVFRALIETTPYSLPGCGVHRAGSARREVTTWLAFEGSEPLGADEQEIRHWALRGVRVFGLVHTSDNLLAASSGKGPALPSRDAGLTDEGRKFITIVHRIGGIVDVSHASDLATEEAIALAKRDGRPVIATHSNARSLAPHARNLKDVHVVGIASTGGVVGVNFHQPFLRKPGASGASLADVVEQVLYLRRLGGTGSVAIGSDFEGGISAVPELSDASRFPRLARALKEAGLSQNEVEAVFFKNAERVLCAP